MWGGASRWRRFWWTVGTVGLVVVISGVTWTVRHGPRAAPPEALPAGIETGVTGGGDPYIGSPQARVTIEEFADFECVPCREFVRDIEPRLIASYVATSKVRLILHTVAFFGGESATAAEGARCAQDQGKLWEYWTAVFRAQETGASGASYIPHLLAVARRAGLAPRPLRVCLESRPYLTAVSKETRQAVRRGITVIPALLINGQKMTGDVTFEGMASLIEDSLSTVK